MHQLNNKICKNIIFVVVLYWCEKWFLTLREECRPRVSGNRVLGSIFWPKTEGGNRGMDKNLWAVLLTRHYSADQVKKNEMAGAYGTYGREEMCLQGWWENLKEIDHLEYLVIDERIILKMCVQEVRWGVWYGLVWCGSGELQMASSSVGANEPLGFRSPLFWVVTQHAA